MRRVVFIWKSFMCLLRDASKFICSENNLCYHIAIASQKEHKFISYGDYCQDEQSNG